MKDPKDSLEDAMLKDMVEEVAKRALEDPVFTEESVWEGLEARPEGVSLGKALCMMLNQAHAMGYLEAKRESRIIIAGKPN